MRRRTKDRLAMECGHFIGNSIKKNNGASLIRNDIREATPNKKVGVLYIFS
jgi:hypothetical protein